MAVISALKIILMSSKTKLCYVVYLYRNVGTDTMETKVFHVQLNHIDEFLTLYLGDGYFITIQDHTQWIKFDNRYEWYKRV